MNAPADQAAPYDSLTEWTSPPPNSMVQAVIDLRPSQCKWPLDSGGTFAFCQHAIAWPGRPYCQEHTRASRGHHVPRVAGPSAPMPPQRQSVSSLRTGASGHVLPALEDLI